MSDHRPRLSVDLKPHHQEFLDQLPHGWKKLLTHAWLDITIKLAKKEGGAGLMRLVAGQIKIEEIEQ
jgi:hypothetical protein